MSQTERTPIERVKHFPAKKWSFIPSSIKGYHAIGRTCPSVGSLATSEEVDVLEEEYGTIWPANNLSIVQRLDFIATEMLRQDRLENTPTAHSARKDYLSPYQWSMRSRREMPWPNIAELSDAMRNPSWRVRNYSDRVIDRSFDKWGDKRQMYARGTKVS